MVQWVLNNDHMVGMSCPSWQWHGTGNHWFPVPTLPGPTCGALVVWPGTLFPNSRGNKAAVNLRLTVTWNVLISNLGPQVLTKDLALFCFGILKTVLRLGSFLQWESLGFQTVTITNSPWQSTTSYDIVTVLCALKLSFHQIQWNTVTVRFRAVQI